MTATFTASSSDAALSARIAAGLRHRVGSDRFRKYIEGSAKVRADGRRVDVAVPSPFYADWLGRQFGAPLREAAAHETSSDDVEVSWSVDPAAFGQPAPAAANLPAAPAPVRVAPPRRRPDAQHARPPADPLRYRLEDFLVSSSNRLAHSAAVRAADDPPGAAPFNILFVHGMCGVGKTHLLQGVAARFRAAHPGSRVRCTSGEQFANEFIASVQNTARGRGIEAFRARYRGLDLLCIDDAHFMAGKSATQQEFLHTFDALDLGGARVVIASDNHPREIQKFDHHLVSRCVSGMVVKIEPPDRELRARLAEAAARRHELALADGAADTLAQLSHGSAREVEGAVARLRALVQLAPESAPGGIITPALVRRALEVEAPVITSRRPIRVSEVVDIVCRELAAPSSEVLGSGRHKRVVLARSLAAALARDLTTCSFPEIARALGRDTHSTVIAACRRIREQIDAGAACGELAGAGLDGLRLADLYDRLRGLILRAA